MPVSIKKPWGVLLFEKFLIRTTLELWSDGGNQLSCLGWSSGAKEPDVFALNYKKTTRELDGLQPRTVDLIPNSHRGIEKNNKTKKLK